MPRYTVTKDTFVNHTGRLHKAGEVIDIEWPKHQRTGKSLEPKSLGENLEPAKEPAKEPAPENPAA